MQTVCFNLLLNYICLPKQSKMQADEKEKFYRLIGERIKDARLKSNLTQENFANFLGLSRVSVVNIEKGRQHPPIHLLWTIAKVLNTSVVELIPTIESEESSSEKWKEIITKKSQGSDQTNEKLLSFIEKLQKNTK
jgi:transcriptional regulator with XRE-family HTH domain